MSDNACLRQLPTCPKGRKSKSKCRSSRRGERLETETHVVPAIQPIPADAILFRFPRGLAWVMLGSALLFASAVVLCAVILTRRHGVVLAIVPLVAFGAISVLSFRSSLRLFDSVAVNSNGIWYVPRNGQLIFLAWHDIGAVVAQDVQQRLLIVDAAGQTTIRLEYQLAHFQRLRDFVLSHTSARTRVDTTPMTEFHRTWINKLVLLFFSAPLLVVAWAAEGQGQWGASVMLVVFATVLLLSITLDPLRVLVEPQAVVITYPGWKRKIPFSQITDISLTDESFRGNVFAAVVIRKSQGKPIKLYRFREGSLALYETLKAAWRRAGSDSC